MLRRIALIGATGFFGRRLAERLAELENVTLVVTSRSAARATQLASELAAAHPNSKISGVSFDRDDPGATQDLASLVPWLVIDASGPFQAAGYELARDALEMGAHWIDLADARNYLLGFAEALDPIAQRKKLVALAGASSTPALSTAVAKELTRGWRRVDAVDIAIMPGGAADVGQSVIRAILSYAGRPIATFEDGKPAEVVGWGSVRRVRTQELGARYVSPVETADSVLLGRGFAINSRVTFSAGLESRLEQFGLSFLAWLRSRGLVRQLEPLAGALQRARGITRLFASDTGGMTVDCAGLDCDGRQVSSRWLLIAKKGQGPIVPVLPAIALTRALLLGVTEPGARTAGGVLPLAAIEAEMRAPDIITERTDTRGEGPSIIERACGKAYHELPRALTAFHDRDGPSVSAGEADIDASETLVGRLMRAVFGFPPSGRRVPVTVTVDRLGDSETWTRNFAGRRFASRLTHEGGNLISERFGPFKILLGLSARNGAIEMPVVGWRLDMIPLPKSLAPQSDTREYVDGDNRFRFDVGITLPLVGQIAHYRGWLEPQARTAEARQCICAEGQEPT